MRQLVSGICFVVLLASCPPAWAKRPTVRLLAGARANFRESRTLSSEAVARAELDLIDREGWRMNWRLIPFSEIRRDVDRASWSRVELGAELGVKPFPRWSPPFSWFYLGQGLHQAWLSPGNDHPEWEIRTVFEVPLEFLKVRSEPVSLYALNEYTYDLEQGSAIRNEIGAGWKVPLPWSGFHALLGWRHIDRIHDTDMDQFDSSLQLKF